APGKPLLIGTRRNHMVDVAAELVEPFSFLLAKIGGDDPGAGQSVPSSKVPHANEVLSNRTPLLVGQKLRGRQLTIQEALPDAAADDQAKLVKIRLRHSRGCELGF